MKYILIILLISNVLEGKGQSFNRSELPVELNNPWEITYGPDNRLWITESPGIVTWIDVETNNWANAYSASDFFWGSPLENHPHCSNPPIGVGTYGLALHPDFLNPETAYIYYVYSYNAGTDSEPKTQFKIKRLKWDEASQTVIQAVDLITDLPTGYDHLGGRLLAVEQDDQQYLFLTIGDHGISDDNSPDCYPDQNLNPNNLAQDPTKMNGKIHRFNIDGTIPIDNPIAGNSFYTRGHRNPQGLIYNSQANLIYAIEHGDRTDDEINILKKGMNYGWKNVRGYHDGNHPNELDFVNNYLPNSLVENDALEEAFYSWCSSPITGSTDYLNWCTVAPCDGIYYCSASIPQWSNSILVVTLKDGDSTDREVYQFKLKANGELMPSTANNPNPKRFFGEDQELNGRLRDIEVSPDGKKIYLINNGGADSDKVIVYTIDSNNSLLFKPTEEDCIRVFPNPVKETLWLHGVENIVDVQAINLFSTTGELLKTVPNKSCYIDVAALSSGTYYLEIVHNAGICATKFVKQ